MEMTLEMIVYLYYLTVVGCCHSLIFLHFIIIVAFK